MDALSIVEDEVRELVRRRGLDPAKQPAMIRALIDEVIRDYDERALLGAVPSLGSLEAAQRSVFDNVSGFGPLQPLLDDPSVEEIWVNSPHQIFCARGGQSELTHIRMESAEIAALVERMLKSSGRRLDLSQPFVDCQLPDGSRLHVVIPDITHEHWAINIRKFIARAGKLEDLVELGSLSEQAARFLSTAIGAGLNVIVTGPTQAGKTTMLNCLASAIGPRERIITIEEIFELNLSLRDVVAMQTRLANLEGTGEITMRRLVKEALRMRPERIIVGEVREAESLDMLIALNSGIAGLCTLHANSARDAITKICTLPLLAGPNITSDFTIKTVAACIDLVVHCVRSPQGHRYVNEILSVRNRVEEGQIESSTLFERQADRLQPARGADWSHEKFDVAGINIAELMAV
ncbi:MULTISPECIES: CpaF family protein [Glutamicibacter]|uniref:Pilus assembly protein CpaF n=1 Tax=Glutamicibacter mysorens TaxID=257984 RepID=A0ABX4N0L1_9MICC|nr:MULTISPECIES: ATPase, T2SS/T4P/T4SS family [Glutamicibacter]KWR73294.1 pilus assembly protein CpaF [Arthrobacter sp. W1]PJJ43437.1 pilus assembly protein CpaF [Glutamicibacter mysorens]UTM47742.1 Flp pilus assembly complex ATPase component TadA [Glutamicibacter mysorens]WIV45157.1 ATPase, T2SS/T4P/T4SS family [Glutamicibacter nicotianae]